MFGLSDPQALLRPWRDLRQFSEELYSMMVSRAAVQHDGPVTIRVRDGQPGLKLTRSASEPPPPAQAQVRSRAPEPAAPRPRPQDTRPGREPSRSFAPPPAEDESSRAAISMPALPPSQVAPEQPRSGRPQASQGPAGDRGRDARRRPPEARPLLEVEGPARFSGPDPVRFDEPPQVYDKRRHAWYTPPAFKLPDDPSFSLPFGGAGTTVFIGKVSSGSGDTYQVALYPDGHLADAGDTVEVKIPMIDPGETINPGTWLFGIYQFTDTDGNITYSCQPPLWID